MAPLEHADDVAEMRAALAAAAPHMAGSGEAEGLEGALTEAVFTYLNDCVGHREPWDEGGLGNAIEEVLSRYFRAAQPDAEWAPQPEPRQDELEAVTEAIVALQDRLHPMWPSPRDYAIAALDAARRPPSEQNADGPT